VHEVNVEKTEVVEAEIDKEEENRRRKAKVLRLASEKQY